MQTVLVLIRPNILLGLLWVQTVCNCYQHTSDDFFSKSTILKNSSRTPSECQTVQILVRPNNLTGLIWVQIVCKDYQQMSADFFKVIFLNSLRKTIRVSNSLDPHQARHFVKSDLGSNCLRRLSADVCLYCQNQLFRKLLSGTISVKQSESRSGQTFCFQTICKGYQQISVSTAI